MAPASSERTPPIALVTGASRGIGAALALALAERGFHLLLTARTEAGLAETEERIAAIGGTATIAPLDLAEGDSIDRLAVVVGQRWGRLDLLALNAATLGALAPVTHLSPAEFEPVLRLNLLAQWRLLRDFDAMLRRAQGTVLALTSSVGSAPRAYWGAYAISKAGLEAMLAIHAAETQAMGGKVLLVDPGATRTAMRARAYPGEDPETVKDPAIVAREIAAALPGLQPGLSKLRIASDGSASLTAPALPA